MTAGIIIPLLVIPLAAIAAFLWYRRKMNSLRVDDSTREMPGVRLTSETLRRLGSPPWRVVYEIRPTQLEGADHVVVGPAGVIAMTSVVADRPAGDGERVSAIVASSALVRAAVDEYVTPVDVRCAQVVKVYWGIPQPDLPPAREGMNGAIDVEGQRLDSWLQSLPPGPLVDSQIDRAWRALVVGIGRPDPLN